jgi:hypothetical protein
MLYDLCKYVIKPSTEACKCSFVGLVTGAGKRVPAAAPTGTCRWHALQHTQTRTLRARASSRTMPCTGCATAAATTPGCAARACRHRHRAAAAVVVRLALVRPARLSAAHSRVRLHAAGANTWGEPVEQFVACLVQHARDRCYVAGDDDSWLDIKYWVCAAGAYYSDEESHREQLVPMTAMVITDGVKPLPADTFSNATWRLSVRQQRFPADLLQAAFLFKVEQGQASMEAGRRHILNARRRADQRRSAGRARRARPH